MNSLVIALQKDALKKDTSITELLHKAFFLAEKLNLNEIKKWIKYELDGYSDPEQIPKYRTIDGTLKANHPIYGWQNILTKNQKIYEIISKSIINQKISEIESLINKNEGQLIIDKTHLVGEYFQNASEVAFFSDVSRLNGIVESIKQTILEWTLDLEKKGVLGEGLSFTEDEIEKANENSITINFSGNQNILQIQQNSNNSTQSLTQHSNEIAKINELINLIETHLNDDVMKEEKKELISFEISKMKEELKSSNPNRSVFKSCFLHIRNLLEGASGSIIASGIIHHLDLFK